MSYLILLVPTFAASESQNHQTSSRSSQICPVVIPNLQDHIFYRAPRAHSCWRKGCTESFKSFWLSSQLRAAHHCADVQLLWDKDDSGNQVHRSSPAFWFGNVVALQHALHEDAIAQCFSIRKAQLTNVVFLDATPGASPGFFSHVSAALACILVCVSVPWNSEREAFVEPWESVLFWSLAEVKKIQNKMTKRRRHGRIHQSTLIMALEFENTYSASAPTHGLLSVFLCALSKVEARQKVKKCRNGTGATRVRMVLIFKSPCTFWQWYVGRPSSNLIIKLDVGIAHRPTEKHTANWKYILKDRQKTNVLCWDDKVQST